MIYLLIDNCTLLQLISENGYNEYITELENLINNGQVRLLTHPHLLQEWENHKSKHKRRKERKLLGYTKKQGETNVESSNIVPNETFINTSHLDLQIQQLDSLLYGAIKLDTPEGIANEFATRYRNGLAPFHKKKDSQNDWEIFGSACNYCERYGIKILYFLSANHNDFADEKEISRTIHPSLQERFSNVRIEYFKNYSDFFKESNAFEGIPHQLIPFQLIANEKFTYKSALRKNDIESLYYLYNELYSEINFIPTHIITRYSPFAQDEKSRSYYTTFSIYNVKESLIELLQSIEITSTNELIFKKGFDFEITEDYREKIGYILTKLTHNLIFGLSSDNRKGVNIHFYKPRVCSCPRCAFNRFEFTDAMQELHLDTTNLKEMLKLAYINYQVGNFEIAAKNYSSIAQIAYTKKQYITYFIAKYNLKHLSNFLDNFFYNKEVNHELVSSLRKIDPLQEAVKLKAHTDYTLVSFIAQEDYFNEAFQKITEEVSNITTHYHSQLKGDWSNNEHITKLSAAFAKLDSFVNGNYILFDQYRNFKELFGIVTEGLFASHAIGESQGRRLEYFDDYWIHKLIMYGDKKVILKFFNRYNLKSLKYKQTSSANDSFIELARNLFKNGYTNKDGLKGSNSDNLYFSSFYNKLFENTLVIGSLLDIDQAIVNLFAELLLKFLKSDFKIYPATSKNIELFIERNGKLIKDTLLVEYLDHFLHNEDFSHGEIVGIVIRRMDDCLSNISDETKMILIEKSLKICNKCKEQHSPNILVSLFRKGDTNLRSLIAAKTQIALRDNFRFQLYYLVLINDVIPFDELKLFELISEIKVDKENHTFRSIFSGEVDHHRDYIDELMNICFKFNVDTSLPIFDKIRSINSYYEWLLDFDNFNYKYFKVEWVLEYQTIYYFRAMSKSSVLLKEVRNYLKTNSHAGIENVLLRITNFIDE